MRRAGLATVVAGALALLASDVVGQSPPRSPATGGQYKQQPLNLRREKLGSAGLGDAARARAKDGDCAGAIGVFDAALRTSTDPTLHRDRGLCHEALGNAYPAIDDYRAYLTAAPEAPDADGIRERLEKLEQATLGYSSASTDAPGDVEGGRNATVSVSAGATGRPSGAAKPESREGDDTDRAEERHKSPLRRHRGWSIGPFFSQHKWGQSPGLAALAPGQTSSFGDSGTWAECVVAQVRYSLGPSAAVVGEVGYEHFNSTAVDSAVVSGLTSFVGYEFRFPLDPDFNNQLELVPGLGFEHLVVQPSIAEISSVSLGALVPRVRFGWRHLFASAAGLELSLDGGAANFATYSKFPFDSNSPTSYFLGLDIGLVWGL